MYRLMIVLVAVNMHEGVVTMREGKHSLMDLFNAIKVRQDGPVPIRVLVLISCIDLFEHAAISAVHGIIHLRRC